MPSRQQPDDWRDIAAALGDRVRELREERALTQEQLAHLAGISRNQVQNIERNRNNIRAPGTSRHGPGNPRLDTLYAISLALEIDFVELLPEELSRTATESGGHS